MIDLDSNHDSFSVSGQKVEWPSAKNPPKRILLILVFECFCILPLSLNAMSSGRVVLEMCTTNGNDVLPRTLFRFSVERNKHGYTSQFLHFYENRPLSLPVFFLEEGFIPNEKFDILWKRVLALDPKTIGPQGKPSAGAVLPQSWVWLRPQEGQEVKLFFYWSPDGLDEHAPPKAKELLNLLWEARGLAREVRITERLPREFSGHCFTTWTQKELNDGMRAVRQHKQRMDQALRPN